MKTINLNVHSSFIVEAVYNEAKQVLRIQISDTWYYYYGVTRQKVARFSNAYSKGQYFCKYIKGQYDMAKRKITKR